MMGALLVLSGLIVFMIIHAWMNPLPPTDF
jgi:hypothetical protein